jgi:ectoine hydroxylase-related dioxygenase (phytanoyl-CoA dioxygenase family)
MVSISVTPEEVSAGKLTPENLKTAVDALREDGIVALKNAVDPEHVQALREKVTADVEALLARSDVPFNWNTGNLQQNPPPFPPYLFKDVLVNELAIQVASQILGPRIKNNFYSGNTALKSDQRQPVHADTGHFWPGNEPAAPAYGIVVNLLLVDVSPENGGTEIWPGSHRDTSVSWFDNIEVSAEALEARRKTHPPYQVAAPAGTLVLRDIRLWHAGMPNHTSVPRPMVALIFWADWMNTGVDLQFPKGTEEFFKHPVLQTQAHFVDGPIDYIKLPSAYAYAAETSESGETGGG